MARGLAKWLENLSFGHDAQLVEVYVAKYARLDLG